MGREVLRKQMKKDGVAIAVCGIIPTLIGFFLIFLMVASIFLRSEWDYRNTNLLLIGAFSFTVGVCIMYAGITYADFKKSWMIRKYPEVLDLIDDLYTNKMYENKDVIVSEKAIASKNHLVSIVNREDVLLAYDCDDKNHGYYGKYAAVRVIYKQQLVFMTTKRTIQMMLLSEKMSYEDILVYCPNAKVGYSKDNIRFVKDKRRIERSKMK